MKNGKFGNIWRASLVDLVRDELDGMTHYFDPDTMRFFGSRINDADVLDGGNFLRVRESVQSPRGGRVHRVAFFNTEGRTVHRTEDSATSRGAAKAGAAWWQGPEAAAIRAKAREELGRSIANKWFR